MITVLSQHNTGASLKNLLNEAAIHAARDDKNVIDWDDVDWAIDRVTGMYLIDLI